MTNERLFTPETAGLVGPDGHGRDCPASSMLSSYLEGTLEGADRARIEEHVSRCEDCYFVVKESALALAALENDGASPSKPGTAARLPGGRPATTFLHRYLLPMAAALVIGVGAVALWRQTAGQSYTNAVRPLVDAVGEQRFFEPRLTGGFKFGPTVSVRRSGGSASSSDAWAMLAVAGELRARAAPTSVAARGSRAAAALFLGDTEDAISEYARLAAEEPDSAEWPSNLAAALLVRASTASATAEGDRADALRYADQAVRLDPALAEAAFNRGLALKGLGRVDEARRAFTQMADRGGSWSQAAQDQLRELGESAAPHS